MVVLHTYAPGHQNPQVEKRYKCILFFVIPVHMSLISCGVERELLLFIKDWIPPHVHQTTGELTLANEKAPKVEPTAVLRYDDIHRLR